MDRSIDEIPVQEYTLASPRIRVFGDLSLEVVIVENWCCAVLVP